MSLLPTLQSEPWFGRPNDVRIDCKAAKHSDGDRGAVLAHLEAELREPRRPPSVDCSSAPLGARANKRRFVNLLQQLGRLNIPELPTVMRRDERRRSDSIL